MAIQRPGSANTSTWFQDDPFAGIAAGLFSSPARPRKDLLGGLGQYGTGPLTHRRFSEQLGDNPSTESLTRARHEDYFRDINNLHNKGGSGRVEDAASAGRSAYATSAAQAGLPAGSLAAIQGRSESAVSAMDQGLARESALEAQLRRDRADHRGNLAQLEQGNADRRFGQFAFAEQMKQQMRQQEQAQYLAERQLQLQALGNPRLANAFANQRRI